MDDEAEGKRTAHGFRKLRDRYVRRAEFLCFDTDYQASTEQSRRSWNTDFQDYTLIANDFAGDGTPGQLTRSVESVWRKRRTQLESGENDLQSSLSEAEKLLSAWRRLVDRLCTTFWPNPDFPPLALPGGHPAQRFVAISLHQDSRLLLKECQNSFPEFALSLNPMPSNAGDHVFDYDTFINSAAFCIPIYPGITDKDLRDAVPEIVRQARALYGTRTVDHRVRVLRGQEMTHRQIAEQLGLTEKTVADTLRRMSPTPRM